MTTKTDASTERRAPLSRERVLRAAVRLADEEGIEAVTMRRLAEQLGVEAMSLYYHVDNKEALVDGLVDVLVNEINQAVAEVGGPSPKDDWKAAMRTRILAAREVMLQHRWAPSVIETRTTMSPEIIRYFENLLGIMREGGFSYDLAHHAMHALGSRALGFTQELFEPADEEEEESSTEALAQMADQFPYLIEMLSEVAHDDPDSTLGWCDDQTEFEFGLDLILDGLERLRQSA